MPKRPRSHRLADDAVRSFEGAIGPTLKFYPRPQPEYGLDGVIEEFDDSDRATGLHFFIQIKGTDEADLSHALTVSITIDTANYYRSAPLPVLMVLYHAPSDELYTRWFHQYDPYYGRGGKKTLTFRWSLDDVLTCSTTRARAAEARAFLALRNTGLEVPLALHVTAEDPSDPASTEARIALRALVAERSEMLVLCSGPPAPGGLWFHLGGEELSANLGKVTSAHLHFDQPGQWQGLDAQQVATHLLILLAVALGRLAQDDLAARLTSTYIDRSSLACDLDLASALSLVMLRAHRIIEALDVAELLDKGGSRECEQAGFLFTLPALLRAQTLTAIELSRYQRELEGRLYRRKKGDPVERGRAYMNLATFHRFRHDWTRAVSNYEQALHRDPGYADRPHYWFELAGARWGIGQYLHSAEAYARAKQLGSDNPLLGALEADSLMFAGRFAHALELLTDFNAAGLPEDDGEYRLKELGLRAIVERLGIRDQDRRMGHAVRSPGERHPETREEWRDLSLHQLQHDALWGSAWLNLGISDAANDELWDALRSFVAATMLIPVDLETWERAIVTALLLNERQILTDLVVSGRRLAGDELVPSLLGNLTHPDSSVSREQAAAAIDKILSAQPEGSRRRTAVRVLSEAGQVEEFVFDT